MTMEELWLETPPNNEPSESNLGAWFRNKNIKYFKKVCYKEKNLEFIGEMLGEHMDENAVMLSEKSYDEFIEYHMENSCINFIAGLKNVVGQTSQVKGNLIAEPISDMFDDYQKAAVEMAISNKYSMVLGYAGTGKTTIINEIARIYGYWNVAVITPTGKAAKVARSKTNPNVHVSTIHKFLNCYIPSEQKQNRDGQKYDVSYPEFMGFAGRLKGDPVRDVIIIDEVSMVPCDLIKEIIRLNPKANIVLMGDNGQLPAIGLSNVIPMWTMPWIQLQEVYRIDSGDNSILDFATALRNNVDLRGFENTDSLEIIESSELVYDVINHPLFNYREIFKSNQVVLTPYKKQGLKVSTSAFNETFNEIFGTMLKGYKLVINNVNDGRLVNGSMGILYDTKMRVSASTNKEYVGEMLVKFHDEGMLKLKDKQCWSVEEAYSLTIHKSQGSEFNTVFIMIPNNYINNPDYRKALYTAVTRAKSKVIIFCENKDKALGLKERI